MRILIADGDQLRAKTIAEACIGRDYQVDRCKHGAEALELALELLPDVVICPLDLAVIDAVHLSGILRSNPRTQGARFVFLVEDETQTVSPDPRDAHVAPPWPVGAVLSQVVAAGGKSSRHSDRRPETVMGGELSEIGTVDLLQLFQMNEKSGVLKISGEGPRCSGSIVLETGQVVDASVRLERPGAVVGEKAFYRILGWDEGRFEFIPGSKPGIGRIRKPMRALLMEGMRQLDEAERQRAELPAPQCVLRLKLTRERVPANVHPLTREVIGAIDRYGRVQEIVDRCSFPDYQVLRVLADLIRRGAAEIESSAESSGGGQGGEGGELFTPTQVRRLREWMGVRTGHAGAVLKLVVSAADSGRLRAFAAALGECSQYQGNPRLSAELEGAAVPGVLGEFRFGEGLTLRIMVVPSEMAYAPLWGVASHGMLGAIILPAGPYGVALERTEAVFERLREPEPRRVLHLLLTEAKADGFSDETLSHLATLEGGSFFVLPAPPSPERVPVLRSLFARLVP